jgi:hypothetical protein
MWSMVMAVAVTVGIALLGCGALYFIYRPGKF